MIIISVKRVVFIIILPTAGRGPRADTAPRGATVRRAACGRLGTSVRAARPTTVEARTPKPRGARPGVSF